MCALMLRLGMLLAELDLLWQHTGCLLHCQMSPAVMHVGARTNVQSSPAWQGPSVRKPRREEGAKFQGLDLSLGKD